jgi:hypothetical protein
MVAQHRAGVQLRTGDLSRRSRCHRGAQPVWVERLAEHGRRGQSGEKVRDRRGRAQRGNRPDSWRIGDGDRGSLLDRRVRLDRVEDRGAFGDRRGRDRFRGADDRREHIRGGRRLRARLWLGLSGLLGLRHLLRFSGLMGLDRLLGFNGDGFSHLLGFSGLHGLNGLHGLSHLLGFSGLHGPNSLLGLSHLLGFGGLLGFNGLNGFSHLLGFNGLNGFSHLLGFGGLDGFNGLHGLGGLLGLNGLHGLGGLLGFGGLRGLDRLRLGFGGLHGFNGLLGLNGLHGLGGHGRRLGLDRRGDRVGTDTRCAHGMRAECVRRRRPGDGRRRPGGGD